MKKILVTIVNYKSTKDTIELLESMKTLAFKDYDVIVVDNNSNEDLSQLNKYKIKIIENKKNCGFTGAVNQVFKQFKYDYYYLINPDTILHKDVLNNLLDTAEKNHAGFVGSAIYSYWDMKLVALAGRRNFITGLAFPIKDINDAKELNGITDYVDACSLLISREVIDKVGLFDEKYFMYLETEDLIARAKKENIKVITNPKAIVYHKGYGSSHGKKSKNTVYLLNKNRIYFMKKFLSPWKFSLFLLVNTFIVFPAMFLIYLLKGRFSLMIPLIKGNFTI